MGLIVLSLFDGISCGRIALEGANLKVDKYYSSEIDKYAEKISESNYPDIIRLGDITKWKKWKIEKPDIIMAGSPCQGFSFAGKQLNFSDPRSKLFFVFIDILKYYKPKYFLLENVIMKYEYNDVISKLLGELYPERVKIPNLFYTGRLSPVMINSALVSAQNRERLYWCNWDITQPKDKHILLKNILENYDGKSEIVSATIGNSKQFYAENKSNKAYCLLANHSFGIKINNQSRLFTRLEVERLQTVPDNYCRAVSKNKVYHAIGNGWTVDIISHILQCNKDLYNL